MNCFEYCNDSLTIWQTPLSAVTYSIIVSSAYRRNTWIVAVYR